MPLLILVGADDDWTGAQPCRDLAAQAGSNVRVVAFPGAVHDFDDPAARPRVRTGLAFTVGRNGEAHVGFDAGAAAQAVRDVDAFLAREDR